MTSLGDVQITAGKPWYPRKFERAPRRSMTSRATSSMSAVVAPGRAAAVHFSCISATTRPALRMRAIWAGVLRVITAVFPSPGAPRRGEAELADRSDRLDHPFEHVVGVADPVNGGQHAKTLVELEERAGLFLVELQPALDRLRLVVLPLDDVSPVLVTQPRDPGRGGDVVGRAAGATDTAPRDPVDHDFGGHVDVDGGVEPSRPEETLELLGLDPGAGEAVEDEPDVDDVLLRQPFGHDPDDDVVGDQLAALHELLGFEAERGAGGGGRPEHVTGRDVGHAVVRCHPDSLSAFARPLLAEDEEPYA